MKINIIGPSCVGKTTVAEIVAQKYNWRHFDLDLVFIDRDYLALTRVFRFRPRADYTKKIKTILSLNKDWIVEGIYAVDKVFKEADLIILIDLPLKIALFWQWKRYFTDESQRSTYGFINNLALTKQIMGQYLKKHNKDNFGDETNNYVSKYNEMLKKYKSKLKVITRVEDLEKLKNKGSIRSL